MSKIQLLDCTLRDGGYINNFRFGKYAIRKILQQLTHAGWGKRSKDPQY